MESLKAKPTGEVIAIGRLEREDANKIHTHDRSFLGLRLWTEQFGLRKVK